MELLGDVRHVESHFFPFGDCVSVSGMIPLGFVSDLSMREGG